MKILDVPQSGSLAGTTSSRNRFGQYQRSRAIPVNPNTLAQQNARNALTGYAIAWRSLDQVARDAWASYSAEHPVTDSLGQSNVLTGMQQFVGVNSALAAAGLATTNVPPSSSAPDAPVLTIASQTVAEGEVDATPDPVPANTSIVWEASPPLSAGRSFNKDFRIVKVQPAATAGVKVGVDDLAAKFGSLAAGMKFFIRARFVQEDGSRSAYTSTEIVLVTA